MSNYKVKYGLIDFGECREAARSSFDWIMEDFNDIKSRYISLGFHLNEFDRYKYYKDFGYASFNEFCEHNIPMDKSAISRCINVWSNFCMIQGSSKKIFIDEKYREYSYSQLCEMLPLNGKQRDQVKPDMTVRQIRELKKKPVATSQQDVVVFDSFDMMLKLCGILKGFGCSKISHTSLNLWFTAPDGREFTITLQQAVESDG